jgi:quinol monooxygenase YgiN
MSTHVVNEFHALPDRADDVMNLLIELSPISRTRPGCQAISLRRNQDDPTNIVGDTRWDTRQDYDNYLAGEPTPATPHSSKRCSPRP